MLNFARYHGVGQYLLINLKQAPVKQIDETVVSWKNFTVKNADRSVEETHDTIARVK